MVVAGGFDRSPNQSPTFGVAVAGGFGSRTDPDLSCDAGISASDRVARVSAKCESSRLLHREVANGLLQPIKFLVQRGVLVAH